MQGNPDPGSKRREHFKADEDHVVTNKKMRC